MRFGIIFLAGVHGVGKGYLADVLVKQIGLPSYSASSLIHEKKRSS